MYLFCDARFLHTHIKHLQESILLFQRKRTVLIDRHFIENVKYRCLSSLDGDFFISRIEKVPRCKVSVRYNDFAFPKA